MAIDDSLLIGEAKNVLKDLLGCESPEVRRKSAMNILEINGATKSRSVAIEISGRDLEQLAGACRELKEVLRGARASGQRTTPASLPEPSSQ